MTGDANSSPDAIVIGSGFGGAVSACRLAESGRRVVVLERGPSRTGSQFPRLGQGLSSWLWNDRWDGFFDLRVFRRIATLASAGVGGGSHAYANVHIRAPERTFRQGWPAGMGPELLAPYYDRVERTLGVTQLPDTIELEKTAAFDRIARELGADLVRPNLAVHFSEQEPAAGSPVAYDRDPYGMGIAVEQAPCRMCGECDIGCTTNSKNTLDLNYLAIATQRHGAEIRPGAEVKAIRPTNDGYRVHFKNRVTGRMESIWAPLVVLSAGTVNSNELLLRCKEELGTLPNISDALGRHFSGNGDFLGATVNADRPLNPWHGPTITRAIRHMDEEHHFYLEEGGFSPDLAFIVGAVKPRADYARKFISGPLGYAARLQWFYKEVARMTGDSAALERKLPSRTMIFLGMGEDASDGRITLRKRLGRRPALDIEWDHGRTRPLIAKIEAELRRISTALGGQYVANPLWSVLGRLITVHPLGGIAIADSPDDGVLNPMGEVWGYPNLYVADGSAVPRAIGPNPSLTISALAERTAEHITRSSKR